MERKHYFLILGTVCLGLLVGSGVFALSGGQAEKFLVSKEAAPVSLTPLEEAQKDYAGVAITYQFGDKSENPRRRPHRLLAQNRCQRPGHL